MQANIIVKKKIKKIGACFTRKYYFILSIPYFLVKINVFCVWNLAIERKLFIHAFFSADTIYI